MKLFIIGLFSLISITGCSVNKSIKVVDPDGEPIRGALVFSEKVSYITQPWTLAAYITGAKGEARVVNDRGYIFKPGYFPIIDGSELSDAFLFSSPSRFSKITKMYPIKTNNNIPVQTSTYTIDSPIKEELFAIPIEVCGAIDVTYNLKNSHLTARSNSTDLIASERFFFAYGNINRKVSRIEQKYSMAYYCEDNGTLFKVGISFSDQVWSDGKLEYRFAVFTASVPSLEAYLQPNIKCMTQENAAQSTSYGKYNDSTPKLLVSQNLKDKIGAFKETIPCANEYSAELLNHIESFLHAN